MRIRFLGTGSGDGWPNPFCQCPSCTTMRSAGRSRLATSMLVDDNLLLDCGPNAPAAASRQGVDLAPLRWILLTHAHPDHCAPAMLLWRSFAQTSTPLLVAGPKVALDGWAEWVGPDSGVSFRVVSAGDRIELDGYVVQVHAANHGDDAIGEAVLYDVATADRRLLYATDTGPLPAETIEAMRDARYDLVALEETFGDRVEHATRHLDLRTFPEALTALREVSAVCEATRVVAVHLSHNNPPEAELHRRLAQLGAELVDDGTLVDLQASLADQSPGAKRVLVTGGARSGKSRFAEGLLESEAVVEYVATASAAPDDLEWQARISEHRSRRPASWLTVESDDLARILGEEGAPILIDCLSLWLAGACDRAGLWDDGPSGEALVAEAIDELVDAWRSSARHVVAVTNEVGSGIVPDTISGRRYRDALGILNARIAAVSDETWLVVAGRPLLLP